jgi:hypothetical protein
MRSFRSVQTDHNFPELNFRELIDKCVEELTDNFKSAISVSVPKRKINPLKNPYSEEIKVLIRTRNRKKAKKLLLASLSAVQGFFTSWKIKLNSKKTKFTILTKSKKMVNNTKTDAIRFGTEEFSWSPSVRYLGVQLDQKLTFKQHVDDALRKAKSLAFSTLYCLLKRGNKVREREIVAIYRSISTKLWLSNNF